MEIQIEKNKKTRKYKSIKSWSDVTLEKWLKLISIKTKSKSKEAKKTIAALSDIPEKLISSLIYVNQTGENVSLGTDLYDDKLELKHTVPFWHNYGYVFHGHNKWHGMDEGKQINVERRGIQLNYVTFKTDWKVYE